MVASLSPGVFMTEMRDGEARPLRLAGGVAAVIKSRLGVTSKSGSRERTLEILRGTLPRREARWRRVDKGPARGGIGISKDPGTIGKAGMSV